MFVLYLYEFLSLMGQLVFFGHLSRIKVCDTNNIRGVSMLTLTGRSLPLVYIIMSSFW
jgi:hypothetical protein